MKSTQQKDSFTLHPILMGVGSLMNVFGDYYQHRLPKKAEIEDEYNPARSWEKIGQGLWGVLYDFGNFIGEPLLRATPANGDPKNSLQAGSEMANANIASIQDDLTKIIEEEGASIPPKKVRKIAITIATMFSGPIPSPQYLAEYERVLPGCAERLIAIFENDCKLDIERDRHKMALESKTLDSDIWLNRSGQIGGSIIVFICLGITAWMGYLGDTVLATALSTTTVIGLATIYILGKQSQLRNVKDKGPEEENTPRD